MKNCIFNQDKGKIEQLFAPTKSQVNIYFQVELR